MKVDLASTAGFCFGVSKAVNRVNELLAAGEKVCTLGPIIHNPQVVEDLKARGVGIVSSPAEVPKGVRMIIRSHGVGEDVYAQATALGVQVEDATCPFVAKIHRIVKERSEAGAVILIAGDENHPEVIGIRGHVSGESYVFSTPEELVLLAQKHPDLVKKPIAMVSQTTFNIKIWRKCEEISKKHYTNLELFDTICNATAKRQEEAVSMAQSHQCMVIVGGRQSSNTEKLRSICAACCPTYLVETAAELKPEWFAGATSVGLTAGASTPSDIIKEVHITMSEIVNNEVLETEVSAAEQTAPQKPVEEMSFEEALEESLKSLNTDERVNGIVVAIAPNEVQVEVIGRKQTGYIPASELSADPNVNPADVVKIGDELNLLIMRTNDQEGTIMLSKKRVDAMKGWDTIVAASESGEILTGTVAEIIKGGVLVVSNGVRVFVPASQASVYRMDDLSPLKGTEVRFRVIEVNTSRRRAVGSIRAVAREERKEKEEAFWSQAEVGQTYKGVVKSMTSYGAFVDIGGVDGMVHISELSWNRVKHPSDVLTIGQEVEVTIKDLDVEKKKISLSYRKADENPWEIFKRDYALDQVVTVKIVSMTTFGAFAQIIPGVDGLIHISQIANHRVEKPQDELKVGQEVDAMITGIDYDKKRISLSIRALLPEEVAEAPAEEAVEEVAAEEATEEAAE
ncbi:MAG: bifunctional 4-hydroxy-3-methylbut-2-enyl diphosphate reductase/30S ribosomal protein S1 [Clostridia bacterium]|nr:bifunctional 4-hydroxy-3-methylbut-2-enyl diphosphate reductase/30S ribosomal protein S1 [Clostridia bacterium]